VSRRTSNGNHKKWPEVTQGLCFIRKVVSPLLKYKDGFFLQMSLCNGFLCVYVCVCVCGNEILLLPLCPQKLSVAYAING